MLYWRWSVGVWSRLVLMLLLRRWVVLLLLLRRRRRLSATAVGKVSGAPNDSAAKGRGKVTSNRCCNPGTTAVEEPAPKLLHTTADNPCRRPVQLPSSIDQVLLNSPKRVSSSIVPSLLLLL